MSTNTDTMRWIISRRKLSFVVFRWR